MPSTTILLLNLNWAESGELGVMGTEQSCLPLEFTYIRSDLKNHDLDSSFIDLFSSGAALRDIEDDLKKSDIVVVCSAPSYVFWRDGILGVEYVKDSIREIKAINPDTSIVLIGPHGTVLPETLFVDELDYLVRGEPDLSISGLISAIRGGGVPPDTVCHQHGGKWVCAPESTEIDNLDDLPFADYSGFDLAGYHFPMAPEGMGNCLTTLYEASRGCMHNCVYCWRCGFREKYRTKSVARIKDELARLKADGVKYVYLIDEVFPTGSAWSRDVCSALAESGMKWGSQTRPDFILDDAAVEMAVRTGCKTLEVGLETADRECYRRAKKTEEIDLRVLAKNVGRLTSHGVQVVVFTLAGLPGDSPKSLLRMVKSFKGFPPEAIPGGLWSVLPLPGTPLWEMGIREGKTMNSWDDIRKYEGLIGNEFESSEELEETRKRAADYLQFIKELGFFRREIAELGLAGTGRARRVVVLFLRYRLPWMYRYLQRAWRGIRTIAGRTYELGICVVGCGSWGGYYSELLSGIAGVKLFFCSRDPARAIACSRKYRGKGHFNTIHDAVRDDRVDAFMVFTPHNVHLQNVRDLAGSGKYVLLQKPMAATMSDATEISRLCEQEGTRLMLAENYRFAPALVRAKKLIVDGRIGKPVSATLSAMSRTMPRGWRTSLKANGGGVLVDFGVHYLSALRFLFGEPRDISSVSSEHGIPSAEGESLISFSATMAEGVTVSAKIAWGIGEETDQEDIITIAGEDGSLVIDFSKPYLMLDRRGNRSKLTLGSNDRLGHRSLLVSFLTAVKKGSPVPLDHRIGEGDLAFVKRVYDLAPGNQEAVKLSG